MRNSVQNTARLHACAELARPVSVARAGVRVAGSAEEERGWGLPCKQMWRSVGRRGLGSMAEGPASNAS